MPAIEGVDFTRGSERIDVLMGGLDQPSAGTIDVGGTNIASLSGSQLSRWRSHHIGFVFQLYNLLPVLTAERNVDLPLLLTKLSKAERQKRVDIALKVVGLADRAKRTLHLEKGVLMEGTHA